MRRFAVPAVALLTACGAPPEPAPAAAPAPPPPVTYGPASVRYAIASHRHVEQEISGRTMTTTAVSRYQLRLTVEPGAGGMTVRFVLDSVRIEGEMGVPDRDIEAAEGTRFTARMGPDGALTAFTVGDTGVAYVEQIAARLRDFFPRIPADGIVPGRRWRDTTALAADVGGVVLNVVSRNTHEALEWDRYADRPALPIRTVSSYTLSGAGEQGGQPLALEGTGMRHTRNYLAPDGTYLGGTAADTSRFEVRLTEIGLTVPGRQWRADTIAVRP